MGLTHKMSVSSVNYKEKIMDVESATIENGYVVYQGHRLARSIDYATNEFGYNDHGYGIGLTWAEVVASGGIIWVSERGEPYVDVNFSTDR
jgi:hypothetical protein